MKVIFLDIDGVLQPYNSGERFEHDSEKIVQELTDKKGIDYSQYYKIDVAAAYYDWDYSAVNTLRYILEQTDAKIVVSSDWRDIKRPRVGAYVYGITKENGASVSGPLLGVVVSINPTYVVAGDPEKGILTKHLLQLKTEYIRTVDCVYRNYTSCFD